MDPLIENLKSTTFFGKRLTRRQIADIQETVGLFPKLSRTELGHTICEHLRWQTPKGSNRIHLATRLLEELERLGILTLPARSAMPGRGPQRPITPGERTAPQPPLREDLSELTPLALEAVTEREAVAEWNEWVERYHPQGYRQPIGAHLRYFLLDRHGRQLGCLLFGFATRNLECRDTWIGWQGQAHRKHLDLVISNSRFLLFPWVQVKFLASKALGLALQQLPQDWQQRHGYRPVLVETFVDLERYRATCYRAANWQFLGMTKGRKARGTAPAKTPKGVYVYPLHPDWRTILLHGPGAAARPGPLAKPRQLVPQPEAKDRFVQLWQGIIGTVVRVAGEYDRQWQQRQRVLNTLLVVLFVFRLLFAPDRQGYALTLAELWEQCRRLGIALPQPQPVSASSICAARAKIHADVFRRIHRAILEQAPRETAGQLWHGHRIFAVDGSKLNLPRPLVQEGYRTPSSKAHYPQGLLSCLYQLRSRIPVDFDLLAHGNERLAALAHLRALAPGDVVVYDRGYYSFQLLHAHAERRLQAVFRLQRNASALFRDFILGDRTDHTVTVTPSADALRQHPQAAFQPCRVRLIKYTAGTTTYTLATTLLDRQRYSVRDLADLYHGRWSIEELYKISKQLLTVEEFHGQTERTVQQELFAHFSLIALARLFTNRSEESFRADPGKPAMQANFKSSLRTVARHLEGLFLEHAAMLGKTVERILAGIAACRQRQRPNRSFPRLSRKPASKWRSSKATATATTA